VETVGVGQVEVEVAAKADTTIVVVNPGWGDEVQAAKAGLLEIADVFVVNKADRPGSDQTRADLEQVLALSGDDGWRPPVVATVATTGLGVAELWASVEAHRCAITADGELEQRRRARRGDELRQAVHAVLEQRARAMVGAEDWAAVEQRVLAGTLDVRVAAERLVGG
jgi:LAO/AO transport system kinase